MSDLTFTVYDPSFPSGSIESKYADDQSGSFAPYYAQLPWFATNITASGTSSLKSTDGVLGSIIFNKAAASSVTQIVHSGSNSRVAMITNPGTLLHSQMQLTYNCYMPNGIKVITSGSDDITVLWR